MLHSGSISATAPRKATLPVSAPLPRMIQIKAPRRQPRTLRPSPAGHRRAAGRGGRGTTHTGADFMKTNVGGIDRVLRIVVGAALVLAAAFGAIGAWGYLGLVPLVTGAVGTCPLYSLLGMNTCPMKRT